MHLEATELTEEEIALQREVRNYLPERLPAGSYSMSLGISSVVDPVFSRNLGAKGWLGMAPPKEYGGGSRTAVERLVVSEELFAVGVPTGYQLVADRQYGPNIAK